MRDFLTVAVEYRQAVVELLYADRSHAQAESTLEIMRQRKWTANQKTDELLLELTKAAVTEQL